MPGFGDDFFSRMKYLKIFSLLSIVLLVTIFTAQAQNVAELDSATVRLVKPTVEELVNGSGDGQSQNINIPLKHPLTVQVLQNSGKPVACWPVWFSLGSCPKKAKGTILHPEMVKTDSEGYAKSEMTLGSEPGKYVVSARIYNASAQGDELFFEVYARPSNWVMILIMGLFGGLAMFLYGMDLMSDGLKRSAGEKMRSILGTLTKNRVIGVLVGAFVTMVIQSSSATTVMLVSFVQAQLMTFTQSLGVILGADIGTTITAQMVAFKLTKAALLFVAVGFFMKFISSKENIRNIGETMMGFGLLFFGMHIMSEAMYPLRNYTPFLNLLASMQNPLLGVLIGAIFTALIQSSSAFTGIIIVLAQQNLITLDAAIPLLFGANIGTCITAALASLKTGREAKRVALAHTFFKVGGVLIFIWWIPYYSDFVRGLAENLPRQIAHAHTVFNVGLTLLFFPFTGLMAKFVLKVLPDKPEAEIESPYKARYLEPNLISTPSLALSLAKVEILRMGGKVKIMVEMIIFPFQNSDSGFEAQMEQKEAEVDFLQEQITSYLTRVSRQNVAEESIDEVFQMMHIVAELEQIGDIVFRSLTPLALKRQRLSCQFSEQGKAEIIDYHSRTIKQINRALEVFKDANLVKAKKMEKKYKKYRLMEMSLRRTHFERMRQDVPETIASNEIHISIMDFLKRISSHATNIARILLETKVEPEEHEPVIVPESTD